MKDNSRISLRSDPYGNRPEVDPTAYIDATAQVIGYVRIGALVYIGPGAVIRADEADGQGKVAPIEIGSECNVQDGVIIHALAGTEVVVGRRSSLGHGCIIHGPCTVGEGCFVGFGAKLFDATLGDGVYVGMGAVIQGVELASESLVPPTAPILSQDHVIKYISAASPADHAFMEKVVAANLSLVEGYSRLDNPYLGQDS